MRKFLGLIFCCLGLLVVLPTPSYPGPTPPSPPDPYAGYPQSDPGYFFDSRATQHLCLPGYYCPGGDRVLDDYADLVFCDYDKKIYWTDDCPNEPECSWVEVGADNSYWSQYWSQCGIIPCPDGTTSNAGAVSASDCFAAATEISCNAGTYLPANASSCTQCPQNSYCPGGDYTPGSTNQGINSCPSNYPNSDAGATTITQCYTTKTATCSQNNGSTPTGCASVTEWNACSCAGTTYKQYSNTSGTGNGSVSGTTNETCTKTVKSVTASANYYANGSSCTACPSGYPNSVAGATTITQCYSNTKSRAWTGSQLACSVPTGCLSATCNECSGSPCNYTVYSNSSGNGDGTLRSGCSTNNTPCQQTVGDAIADANYYSNGTSCTACPFGTFSPIGSTALSDCAKILNVGNYVVYMPIGKHTDKALCMMTDDSKVYCADVYEKQ